MNSLFDDERAPVADVRRIGPTGQPFINGVTPQARHSSWTGAQRAEESRSANIAVLRELWKQPHTINEIAEKAHLPISSVCSLKAAIEDELEFVDFQIQEWASGRTTKRARWQLKR